MTQNAARYGYRYADDSPVFPLIGADEHTATETVHARRARQSGTGTPPTVQLVRATDAGDWVPVPVD